MQPQPNVLPIFDAGHDRYQLAQNFVVQAGGMIFEIPAGFILDLASVPRLLWCIYPPDGLHRAAVTLHDWLYSHRRMLVPLLDWPLPRSSCDAMMKEVMRNTEGINELTAQNFYIGVRLGGWMPWLMPNNGPIIKPLVYEIT